MDETLASSLSNLKEAIEKDPCVLRLNELDKKLNENEEVMKLAYKKDMALLRYEDMVKNFGENSKEANEAQKTLHEAKYNLDIHPLVKEYNQAYKEVRHIYDMINEELFNKFK